MKKSIATIVTAVSIMALSYQSPVFAKKLVPDGYKVVNFLGGWRDGGGDRISACTRHLQSNFPGSRFEILSTGEEQKWGGFMGRESYYRYRCTAFVKI